jgi:hypothetical protein
MTGATVDMKSKGGGRKLSGSRTFSSLSAKHYSRIFWGENKNPMLDTVVLDTKLLIMTVNVLPSAKMVLENIGFIYPFFVYDGNRPLAPILRQSQCSLLYDVY